MNRSEKQKLGSGKKRKARASSESSAQKIIKTEPKSDCPKVKIKDESKKKRYIWEKRVYFPKQTVEEVQNEKGQGDLKNIEKSKWHQGILLSQRTLKIFHQDILPEVQNNVPIVKDVIKNSQGCENRNIKDTIWKGEGKWPNKKMHNDLIMLRGKKKKSQTLNMQCDKYLDDTENQLTLKIHHQNIIPEEQNDVPNIADIIINRQGCENSSIKEIKWKGEGKWPNSKMYNTNIIKRGKKKKSHKINEKWSFTKISDNSITPDLLEHCLKVEVLDRIEAKRECNQVYEKLLHTTIPYHSVAPNDDVATSEISPREEHKSCGEKLETALSSPAKIDKTGIQISNTIIKKEVLDIMEIIPEISSNANINEIEMSDKKNEAVLSSHNVIDKMKNEINNIVIQKDDLDAYDIEYNANMYKISDEKMEAVFSRPNKLDEIEYGINNTMAYKEDVDIKKICHEKNYDALSRPKRKKRTKIGSMQVLDLNLESDKNVDLSWIKSEIIEGLLDIEKLEKVSLENKVKFLQKQQEDLKLNHLESLKKLENVANLELENKTRILEAEKQEYKSTIDKIKEKSMKLENVINSLEINIKNKDTSIYKVEAKNQELSNENNRLLLNNLDLQNKTRRFEESNSNLDSLKERNIKLQVEVDSVKKILSSRHEKVKELSGQNQDLRNEVKELKEIMSKCQNDNPQKMYIENKKLEAENQEFKSKNQEMLKENERLFVSNLEFSNKISSFEADIKESKSNLEKSLKLVNAKNIIDAEKMKKLECQNQDLRNEVKVVKEIMSKLQNENNGLQKVYDENTKLEAENQEFKAKNQEFLNENEKLKMSEKMNEKLKLELKNKIKILETDNNSEEELKNKIRFLETDNKEYKAKNQEFLNENEKLKMSEKMNEKLKLELKNKIRILETDNNSEEEIKIKIRLLETENKEYKEKNQECLNENEKLKMSEKMNEKLKLELKNKIRILETDNDSEEELKNKLRYLEADNKEYKSYLDNLKEKYSKLVDDKNISENKKIKRLEKQNQDLKIEVNIFTDKIKRMQNLEIQNNNLKIENLVLTERNEKHSMKELENEKERQNLELQNKNLKNENVVLADRNKNQSMKDLENETERKKLEDENANLNMKSTQQLNSMKTQEQKIEDQKEKMRKWMQKYDTVKKENEELKDRKKRIELKKCKLDEEIQKQKKEILKIEKAKANREYFAKQREFELRISQDSFRYIKTVLCQFNLREETLNVINQQLKKISEQLDFETEQVDSNGSSQERNQGPSVSDLTGNLSDVPTYMQDSPASPNTGSYPSISPSTSGGSGLKRKGSVVPSRQHTPHKKSHVRNLTSSSKVPSREQSLTASSPVGEKSKAPLGLKLSLQNKTVNTSQNIAMDEMLDDIVQAIKEGGVFPVEKLKHLDYSEFKDGLLENLRAAGCDINQSDMEKIYKRVVQS